ncbi:MAG TPA: YeiH family protein [Atopostipes sp.]|nr:YeiH family protein [Atopostipes sp.]
MDQIDQSKLLKWELLPGILVAFLIAIAARFLEGILPVDFIGASVIALFIGILWNAFQPINQTSLEEGVTFTSKRGLKLAIILLGASLNLATVFEVGQITLIVLVFTLLTAFGGGYLLGKALGLDWRLSGLIASGTAICGGSAIAAVSPIVDAEDHQISYAMSYTFIFDMFMIILFPLIGTLLNMSDMAFGLWAGTAVNDTSSVLAAGYAFSEAAGDFATMVKLTRTLFIIPTVILFSLIQIRKTRANAASTNNGQSEMNMDLKSVFPWFILGFLAMTLLNSIGLIPVELSSLAKDISKFLMVVALAAVGLKTDLGKMKQTGARPLIQGIVISSLVVVVSLTVVFALNMG